MKIKLDGQWVDGQRVDYTPVDEPWSKYRLTDGTIVRIKLVVADIVRVPVDKPDGEPSYVVKSSNILAIDTPDSPTEVH